MHSMLFHQLVTAGVTLSFTAVGLIFIVFCRQIGGFMQGVSRRSPIGGLLSILPISGNRSLALIPPLIFGIVITLLGLLLFVGIFTGQTPVGPGM
jgi:hypothetical protein